MKRCNYLMILLATGLLSVATESGAQSGWYASYGVGESDSDFKVEQISGSVFTEEIPAASFSTEGDTRRIALGYNVDAKISYELGQMELEKVAGIKEYNLSNGDTLSAVADVEGYYIAAISKYKASNMITITGRLGYYMWEMRTAETVNDVQNISSDDDDDFFYGLGMEIGWLGIEYDILDIDGQDVKYLGATLKYTFK
jgi:hypothetical protein